MAMAPRSSFEDVLADKANIYYQVGGRNLQRCELGMFL